MSTAIQTPSGPDEPRATIQSSDDPAAKIRKLVAATSPEQKRALCKDDFWLFVNIVSYNYLEPKATAWEPAPNHATDSWHAKIHRDPLNMILAGRKHTKTTWILCEALHKWQYQRGFSILYWANTEDQVMERIGELNEMIEANPWLDQLHENGNALGGKESKTFHNGSRLLTTWVEGSVEGGHVNMSIGDDPLKEIGGIPDERIEEWYGKILVPMLNRDGIHIILGTRKRPTDLYEILRTKGDEMNVDLPGYDLLEYPAIREPWVEKYGDERPEDLAPDALYTEVHAPGLAGALDVPGETLSMLWPDGRPTDWFKRQLGGMGAPYFIREFSMVFSQVEDAIIPRAHIDERCSVAKAPPDLVTAESPYERVAIGNDPASTKGSDSTAYVVLGVRPSGVRDILHVFNAERIDPGRFKSKHQEFDMLYSPDTIVIEDNGMQQYIVDDAVEFDRSLPIRGETTTERKHSWEDGIPRIAHRVAQGGYRFYREGNDHTEQLINALTTLTMEEGKLQGHTPDPVIALYLAEKAIDAEVPTGQIEVGQQDVPEEFENEEFQESELGEAVFGALDNMRGGR